MLPITSVIRSLLLPQCAHQSGRTLPRISPPSILEASRSLMSSSLPESGNPHGPVGFVFDIDGVLIRGKEVLDTSRQAIAQVVLSHSPMKSLVPEFGNKPVLIAGRGDVMYVAKQYGFNRVVSTYDLGRAMPSSTPFSQYPPVNFSSDAQICPVRDYKLGTEENPIEAVLIMTDPVDWGRDLQLVIDVVASNGVPTRNEPLPGSSPVQVFFSNPDLLWANEFPRSRFGQGAFAAALCALYKEVTGRPLPHAKYFGKPNPEPYRLAEQLLYQQAINLGHVEQDQETDSAATLIPDPESVHLNEVPAKIKSTFSSIFAVGVFKGPGENCTVDPSHIVVDCVLGAVESGLRRTRSLKFHSQR
eukprot:gene4388-14514_t